ncbi:MAG: hypothetical protein QXS21_05960 [Thermoproteota archaeon]
MVKIKRLELEDLSEYEGVDAMATGLKEPHKRYGAMLKRLAEVLKETNVPKKGRWQNAWGVATRALNLAIKGYSLDKAIASLTPIGDELGVPADDVSKIVNAVYANQAKIIGGARARPAYEEQYAGIF